MVLSNQLKNIEGEPLFIIVKFAAEDIWDHYWMEDPKVTGVINDHNACTSHTGITIDAPCEALTEEQANAWLKHYQASNPSVGYAVCPLIN